MIRKTDDFTLRTNLRGGEGSLEFHTLLTPDELAGKVTLFARVVMPPHSSIGYHPHLENVEYYCILSGEGLFQEPDGSSVPVSAGDVCLIRRGESHGLSNPGNHPLVMLAVIVEPQ